MAPLLDIAMLLATNCVVIEATYIPTDRNQLADDLSRCLVPETAYAFLQLRYPAAAPQV